MSWANNNPQSMCVTSEATISQRGRPHESAVSLTDSQ